MLASLTPLFSVFTRIQELDRPAVVGALAGGVVAAWEPDAFFFLFLILAGSNVADWIFGRHAALARREFDSTKSREGLVGKAAQLVVLLILRSLEAVIPLIGLPSTIGIASSALALALIVEDVESIERHRITLGGKRIPGLSPLLEKIRVVTGGDRRNPDPAIPPAGEGLRRRATDPPPTDPPYSSVES